MDEDYGHIVIQLDKLLKEKGLSKNKLSHKAEMNWKQIDNFCTNKITRLDVPSWNVKLKICLSSTRRKKNSITAREGGLQK